MRLTEIRRFKRGPIAFVAVLSLLAAVLTGLGANSAVAGPGYQKPKTGECRNITAAQSRAKSNSTRPISCALTHTAQTVGVGKLSAKLAKSKTKSKAAMASKCQTLFNKYVGSSAPNRAKSAFSLSVFAPTKAQKKKGATWFRCDATLLRGGSLTPLKTSGKPLLTVPTPSNQALCQTSGGSPTTCDATHGYKATSAFKIKGKKYPGKKKVNKAAKSGCNARVSTSKFRYDAPSAADWDLGKKYVVCFSTHTLPVTPPPPPPPVEDGIPTSTIIAPTSAPVGTTITIAGVANDNEAVTGLTATVRNAGGLYLQDDRTISAVVNNYPVTSGTLGDPSESWTMALGNDLPVGTYTVALTVTDSGNKTVVVSKSFSVTAGPDVTNPTIAALASPTSPMSATSNFLINGTVTDNVQVSTITVQLTNGAGNYLQDNLTTFNSTVNDLPVTVTGLGTASASFNLNTGMRAVDTYSVRVRATDSASPANVANRNTPIVVTNIPGVNYQMNEGAGAGTMLDSGGNGLNGTIQSDADDFGLNSGVTYLGATGYEWEFRDPEDPPAEPSRVIQVPDNSILDAGNDVFTIEMRYRTNNSFGNIMQKGQSTSVGGQWKIQAPGGKPSCLFKDGAGNQASVQSINDLSDTGQWATLRCVRDANWVTMYVNGVYDGRKDATTVGNINNNTPLTIGGKSNCDQITITCDYFSGSIDYVTLTHG